MDTGFEEVIEFLRGREAKCSQEADAMYQEANILKAQAAAFREAWQRIDDKVKAIKKS